MASTASLTSSYQIPALDGRFREATPVKFALKFKDKKGGPSIGVVYTFQHTSKKNANKKLKKYIHEIKVDLPGSREKKAGSLNDKPTLKDVEKLADTLCEKEPTYLNVNIISRTQVSPLIVK